MYGSNDYRNYLSHHGVVGMHWGIRRYQPYSIGYQRIGGKKGKAIGEAKSSWEERRAARREKTLNDYKARESKKIDARLAKISKRGRKLTDRYGEDYLNVATRNNWRQVDRHKKGEDWALTESEKRSNEKALDRYKWSEQKYNVKKGELEATRSILMNYTYEDMMKESRHVAMKQGVNVALLGIGSIPVNILTQQSTVNKYRSKQIDSDTRAKINANAEKKAEFETKDLARYRDSFTNMKKRKNRRWQEERFDKAKYEGKYDTGFDFVNKNKNLSKQEREKEYKKFLKDPRKYYDVKTKENNVDWKELNAYYAMHH